MKNWRINFVFLSLIILSAVLLGKLFFIQIRQGDFYKALAQGFHVFPESAPIKRGEVFLKNGEPLAINKNWQLVWVCPQEIKEVEETARKLNEILGLSETLVLERK